MPQTFALCFVHDLNPDKCNPDKCTTRISAHVLQAPCATFVCNCTQISAQRHSPSKCHSKSWAYTVDCVMICAFCCNCAFCLNGLLYEREKETMSAPKRKLTTLNIDQKIMHLHLGQTRISAQNFLAGSMCTYPGFTVLTHHQCCFGKEFLKSVK
jgi:hypothetical protein